MPGLPDAATLRLVRCPAGWMLALTRTPPAKTRRHAIGSDSTPLVYLSIYTWTYSETIECILLFVMVAASGCRLMLHVPWLLPLYIFTGYRTLIKCRARAYKDV